MATDARFGLEGKHALVLGGGQGMGESTVRLLASAGCNVAVADVIPERAERVAAEVARMGPRSLAKPLGISLNQRARGLSVRVSDREATTILRKSEPHE